MSLNVKKYKLIIQGEHKNTPRFQVVIKSKLTGIFFYKYRTVDTALESRCPHVSQRPLAKQVD